jgi:hypothetical protein
MKKLYKILLLTICLYVIIAKIYTTIYFHSADILVDISNLIVCCSCIYLTLIIWEKISRIRYMFLTILALLFGVFFQTITEGLNVLTKNPNITYPCEYYYIYDIPNLLSILIIVNLIVLLVLKNRKPLA